MKLSTSLEAAETTAELSLRRGQYGGEDSSRVGLAGNEAIGGAGSRIISPRNCTVILLTTIIIFIWFVHSLLSLVFFSSFTFFIRLLGFSEFSVSHNWHQCI